MTQEGNDLVIVRDFDAPRDLVWDVWTQPDHIEKWSGPRGFDMRVTSVDLRVGGMWHYVMIGPDGNDYPVKGVFSEIDPPKKIVTTDEFDEAYIKAHPELTFQKDWSLQLSLTIWVCGRGLRRRSRTRRPRNGRSTSRWVSSKAGVRASTVWTITSRSCRSNSERSLSMDLYGPAF